MKRKVCFFLIFSGFLFFHIFFQILCPSKTSKHTSVWPLSSESNKSTSFYISPKEAYVGDEVILYYEFYSAFDVSSLDGVDPIRFDTPAFPVFNAFNSKINSVEILKVGGIESFYAMRIYFLPFETGIIRIPDFDLRSFLASEWRGTEDDFGNQEIPIKIPEFEIQTVLSLYPDAKLRPMHSIVLLPGTSFFVYLFLFFILLICILFLYFTYTAKEKRFSFFGFFKALYRSLYIVRIKQKIKKLLKKNTHLGHISQVLQKLIQGYITKRFEYDFAWATNTEILQNIRAFYEGLLDEDEEDMLFDLESLFVRLDYLRFSQTFFQKEEEEDEKKILVQQTLSLIEKMERKNV